MTNSENMTYATVPPPSNFPLQGEGLRAKGNWPLPASPSLVERDLGRGQGGSRGLIYFNIVCYFHQLLFTYYSTCSACVSH